MRSQHCRVWRGVSASRQDARHRPRCRLFEVSSFVLSHFTEGSDARRLNELLRLPPLDGGAAGPAMSSTVRIERSLLVDKASVGRGSGPRTRTDGQLHSRC